ncbi:MAG: hypothetical protein K2N74_01770, partial [Clostridiales bacterium]|nr:hypothetical protein [Clostridiales bacterium]
MNKNVKKKLLLDLIILVVLAIAFGVSMIWSRTIELATGLLYQVPADSVDESEVVTLKSSVRVSADGGSGGLYIDYLDVGQGDCTIIRLPDGKTMIIDAGKGYNNVKSTITSFIDTNFDKDFTYFDYAILTHPDDAHCGSWGYGLDKYPARVCYRPNVEATNGGYSDPAGDLPKDKSSAAYKTAVQAMYKEIDGEPNVVYITDPSDERQTIREGEGNDKYTFTFYSPLSTSYTDDNDYSPIMILSYRGLNFAFSGDAEKKNEKEFVERVESARTDGVTDKYDIFTDDYTVNAIK